MSSAPDIIVIGAGGHARVLIEVLRRGGHQVAGAVDIDVRLHGQNRDGVPIIGNDDAIFRRKPSEVVLVNGQGNVPGGGASGLDRRRTTFERFRARGYAFMKVISVDAVIASSAVLEETCQVITGAIVHPGVVIGVNALVNTGARVDHDCRIGAHSHIGPGATLCGGVIVGPECHVGAGAVVIPQIEIGAGAVVGAGAAVVENVASGATVLGVPARAKRAPLK